MQDFSQLMAVAMRTVGTSNATAKIQVATSAAGANAADLVTKTITDQPNAVGDYIVLECDAQQIAQAAAAAGRAYTHASLVLSLATATDEMVVTYIRSGPRFAHDGLTVELIAT